MQTAIGADFWGGVNFLFWGGRISRDSTKRELIFFFLFFFVYSKYSMAGSAENSARKKGGVVCTFFFFCPFLSFFWCLCLSFLQHFLVGKASTVHAKNTQKFTSQLARAKPSANGGGAHSNSTAAEGKVRYDTMQWLLQLVYQKHRATAAPAPYLSPDYPVGTCSMQAKAIAHQVSGR